ncbi:MAG: hypothetical protein QM736_07690 [Vicinamibacterales bacterium]
MRANLPSRYVFSVVRLAPPRTRNGTRAVGLLDPADLGSDTLDRIGVPASG